MNNDTLIKKIQTLKQLQPKAAVLQSVEDRVFAVVNAESGVAPKTVPTPVLSPYTVQIKRSHLRIAAATFCLLLVLSSQAPRYSAYQTSITALAETQRLTEKLTHDDAQVEPIIDSLSQTRENFNNLSLDGAFGLYTQEDCEAAYALYDQYLDSTKATVAKKLQTSTDTEETAQMLVLQGLLNDYHQEAESRIHLYQ